MNTNTTAPTSYDYTRSHVWNALNGRCDRGWFLRQHAEGFLTDLQLRLACQERGWELP